MTTVQILTGDCLDVLPTLEAESVHAIVCDPPYGLSFMGRAWDHGIPGVPFWEAALRVAKPGAHLIAFGGTRTFHRLTSAIEDAGWEIRDCLMWLYGSGFPKSLNVAKAIDAAALHGGSRPEDLRRLRMGDDYTPSGRGRVNYDHGAGSAMDDVASRSQPRSDAAQAWDGWGTALKPAWEPIILARKPLVGTVAHNIQAHGTGALNIDRCRTGSGADKIGGGCTGVTALHDGGISQRAAVDYSRGRWPANLVFDEEAAAMLDRQAPSTGAAAPVRGTEPSAVSANTYRGRDRVPGAFHGDRGGASRFFYCAKASRAERDAGLAHLPTKPGGMVSDTSGQHITRRDGGAHGEVHNHHPTVKPLALMRWLVKLVTPPNGLLLDPFMGSGSTGCAAVLEGFRFIGIDKEPEYAEIARVRIAHCAAQYQPELMEPAA